MLRQLKRFTVVLASLFFAPQVGHAHGWGPALAMSRVDDDYLQKSISAYGGGLTFWGILGENAGGYASAEIFKGESGSEAGEIYSTGTVFLVVNPHAESRGWRPFAGPGAGLGGMNDWSPMLTAGATVVDVHWTQATPFFAVEYATRNQRLSFKVGLLAW